MLFFTIFLLFWQKASFSVYGNKLKIVLCGVRPTFGSFFYCSVCDYTGRRCDVNLNFHLRNHMGDKPLICIIFIYNFTHSYIHSSCNFVMIILDSIIALCVINRYKLVKKSKWSECGYRYTQWGKENPHSFLSTSLGHIKLISSFSSAPAFVNWAAFNFILFFILCIIHMNMPCDVMKLKSIDSDQHFTLSSFNCC